MPYPFAQHQKVAEDMERREEQQRLVGAGDELFSEGIEITEEHLPLAAE